MQAFHFVSTTEAATQQLGIEIGEALQPGTVIGLNGTLGAGKTRLTQAIGQALNIPDGNVVSPTYTICTPHEGDLILVHLDAYRIKHDEEVDELGLDEMVEQGAVLVIEWAQRIEKLIPPIDLTINVESITETERTFELLAHTSLGKKIVASLQGD
jgi:tRNA threonylcarbamoyladenosine biosynthesis protein TsaE